MFRSCRANWDWLVESIRDEFKRIVTKDSADQVSRLSASPEFEVQNGRHFMDTNKKDLANDSAKSLLYMALPTGFEPVTCPLGGGRAIQLCHGSLRLILLNYMNKLSPWRQI